MGIRLRVSVRVNPKRKCRRADAWRQHNLISLGAKTPIDSAQIGNRLLRASDEVFLEGTYYDNKHVVSSGSSSESNGHHHKKHSSERAVDRCIGVIDRKLYRNCGVGRALCDSIYHRNVGYMSFTRNMSDNNECGRTTIRVRRNDAPHHCVIHSSSSSRDDSDTNGNYANHAVYAQDKRASYVTNRIEKRGQNTANDTRVDRGGDDQLAVDKYDVYADYERGSDHDICDEEGQRHVKNKKGGDRCDDSEKDVHDKKLIHTRVKRRGDDEHGTRIQQDTNKHEAGPDSSRYSRRVMKTGRCEGYSWRRQAYLENYKFTRRKSMRERSFLLNEAMEKAWKFRRSLTTRLRLLLTYFSNYARFHYLSFHLLLSIANNRRRRLRVHLPLLLSSSTHSPRCYSCTVV